MIDSLTSVVQVDRFEPEVPTTMLISDVVMMLCLVAVCVGRVVRHPQSVSKLSWLLVAGALAASAVSVSQGRWQAVIGGLVASLLLGGLVLRWRRSSLSRPRSIGFTLLLVPLVVAAYVPLYLLPVFQLPRPTGPYDVGARTFAMVDSDRVGVMDARADEPRRLLLRAWYPARPADAAAMPYASNDEVRIMLAGLAGRIGLPYFFFSHLGLVDSNSVHGAPVLRGPEPWPVVYFSHGYLSYGSQNTVLMEHLASHGYLVISVTHPYDAAPVVFPDGEVIEPIEGALPVKLDEAGNPVMPQSQLQLLAGRSYDDRYQGMLNHLSEMRREDHRLLRSATAWLDDRLFVSRSLADGRCPDSIRDLVDSGDFSRVAHVGMSFGGSTAAAAGFRDPRCVAAVNLDGGDYHLTAINANPPVPLLMFHSDWNYFSEIFADQRPMDPLFGFNDFSYERHAVAGTSPNVYRLRVRGVRHLGISDYPLMVRQPLAGMLVGSIKPQTMMQIMNDFVLGFLDRHQRGLENNFPAAQFASHSANVDKHDASKVRSWWQTKSPSRQQELERRLATLRTKANDEGEESSR